MLSTDLHEAVQAGYVDLEDKDFWDVFKDRNLAAEEKALATALVKTGKAFVRDPKKIADEHGIQKMIYRGLRRVSPAHAAAFGDYMRGSAGWIMPSAVEKHLSVKKVKGRTGEGWKVTANLDKAMPALAFSALTKILQHSRIPRTQNGDYRKADPKEFMLMAPTPVKDRGAWYWQFKHSDTRNYLFVNAEKGTLYIPTTNKPFMRGEFG